ncbi:MAG: FlgO family outer membrane protein [Gemmatimonadetes bacterium]|nr:FlgO family outer membrane protein [Gemmatimonadota bacterium]
MPLTPIATAAQDLTILVAPVQVTEPVDRRFGERIAEEVMEALEQFPGYSAIDEDAVEDLIDQYDLDKRAMSNIEWRQLATQMNANVVMVGTASNGGAGVAVDVDFIEPRSGDELPMVGFNVPDDDSHEEAAQEIMTQLEGAVEYARAVAFCADYLASEQAADAVTNCTNAIELNPEADRAYYLRGRAHMMSESWGTAAEDLQRVVDNDPSNTEALQSIAFVYAQLGDGDRSLDYYRQYLNFQPDDVDVRLRIAYELANAGGHAEAMSILQDGVERAPDNVQLLEYLGGIALQAGQSDGQVTDADALRTAVVALERLIEIQGDEVSPTTLANTTNAYMLNEEYEEALAFSERALSMIQNSSGGTNGGGEEDGAPGASREQLLGQVHSARAQIYDRMELPQEAATEFQQAIGYDTAIPNGYQRLAQYKLKAGDTDGAVADFRAAVTNGADANQIADALFGQGYNDHFTAGRYQQAIDMFNVAAEFADAPDVSSRIHFFAAYGYFQRGTALDDGNAEAEACGPAQAALSAFQNVGGHLAQAGDYETGSQGQIRDAVDVQLYRQEQIIKKSCER